MQTAEVVYVGVRIHGEVIVTRNGVVLRPGRSQAVRNHSPDGFNWGYGGSGPAQLALGLLLCECDEIDARLFYQKFKWEVVALLTKDEWRLTNSQIREWLVRARGDVTEWTRKREQMNFDLWVDDNLQRDASAVAADSPAADQQLDVEADTPTVSDK